jgi:3-phenylpropionate/cinnamic acid dioxygenase small subunit
MPVDLLADGDGFLTGAAEYADPSKWDHWRVLHESAMYFECQAEFDEISRAR